MSETLTEDCPAVQPYELPAAADYKLRSQVERFLCYDAELLDAYRLLDWMRLVTPDFQYCMPVRNNIDSLDLDAAFSERAFHMIEDYGSLNARMKRLVGGLAWSEKPPSRIRRHVSNIRVAPPGGEEIGVKSNLLFFWGRDETSATISAERRDTLRLIDGRLYLAQRHVLLDHLSIPIPNLSVVL